MKKLSAVATTLARRGNALSLIVTTALLLAAAALWVNTASAQSTAPVQNTDFLPADTAIVYEINMEEKSFLQELLMFPFSIAMQTLEDEAASLAQEIIENNTFTIGGNLAGETTALYGIFNMTEDQWRKAGSFGEQNTQTEQYKGQTLITAEGGVTWQFSSEKAIVTSTKEDAMKVADVLAKDTPSLSKDAGYQSIIKKRVGSKIFSTYINLQEISEVSSFSELFPNAKNLFKTEDLSISQTGDGFDFSLAVEGNASLLESLRIAFNKHDFTPSLYRSIAGENIMLYSEANNLQGQMADFVQSADAAMVESYNTWKAEVKEATDINIDREVLPLMSGKFAFALHESATICPGVTLILDVTATQNASGMLATLNNKLKSWWEKVSADSVNQFYSYRIDEIGGHSYYSHIFTPPENPMLKELALHMAIVDNRLIISTHPDLATVLDGSMTENTGFEQQFKNPDERVSDLQYVSFTGIQQYLITLSNKISDETLAKVIELTSQLLNPWNDLISKSFSTASMQWATGSVRVDVEGFSEYPRILEEIGEAWSESMYADSAEEYWDETVSSALPSPDFCDVHSRDWFYTPVTSLAQNGIIKGYNDGCFRPAAAVTRAEFLKMALERQAANLGSSFRATNSTQTFTDVPSSTWFGSYVNTAAKKGYIKGYVDGTFKPNATITRAEAVQMLYTIAHQSSGYDVLANVEITEFSTPFTDVQTSDWFFKAVQWATFDEIVSGTSPTTFEPSRNLTRAEAAKLVNNFWY